MDNLSHPSIEDIVPTPHLDVLENISRNFHIKGGISTINQWFTALEIASPEGYLGITIRAQGELKKHNGGWLILR